MTYTCYMLTAIVSAIVIAELSYCSNLQSPLSNVNLFLFSNESTHKTTE